GQIDNVKPSVELVPRPQLRLVEPVPRKGKKGRGGNGSLRRKKNKVEPGPHKKHTAEEHRLKTLSYPRSRWKPSGLTAWELWTRRPSISKNGKRSSKAKYIAYYSQESVRKLHERETKTNLRRA